MAEISNCKLGGARTNTLVLPTINLDMNTYRRDK